MPFHRHDNAECPWNDPETSCSVAAGLDCSCQELYLLCNRSAGFLGNSPVFWRKGGSGYTQWIDEAEHWTEVEADRQIQSCMGSHHFEKIPLSLVERLAKRTLDQQDLNREMDKETTGAVAR